MTKIGKPFTPSTLLVQMEIPMTQITVVQGRGNTGRPIYTTQKPDFDCKFICVDTNVSKNHIINSDYVIDAHAVKIVKVVVRNDGNKNVKVPVGETKTYYYAFPAGEKVNFVDDYVDGAYFEHVSFCE